MPKGCYERRKHNRYTVYNRKTDMPVMIGGTARECAKAMGVTLPSFYSIYSRFKNGRLDSGAKWEVFPDAPDSLEE